MAAQGWCVHQERHLGLGRELHGPPVAVFPSHSMPVVDVVSTPVSYMGIRRVGSDFRCLNYVVSHSNY